jgi:hypothetical protein
MELFEVLNATTYGLFFTSIIYSLLWPFLCKSTYRAKGAGYSVLALIAIFIQFLLISTYVTFLISQRNVDELITELTVVCSVSSITSVIIMYFLYARGKKNASVE